jgi:hypothetical protein
MPPTRRLLQKQNERSTCSNRRAGGSLPAQPISFWILTPEFWILDPLLFGIETYEIAYVSHLTSHILPLASAYENRHRQFWVRSRCAWH